MSATLANPSDMIRQGAPHLIHSDEELAVYTEALFKLTEKQTPTVIDQQAIDLLTLLIDRYESSRFPIPDAEPADVLRVILQTNGLSQCDLTEELGSATTVSLVVSGKRQLTRDHIARLAAASMFPHPCSSKRPYRAAACSAATAAPSTRVSASSPTSSIE